MSKTCAICDTPLSAGQEAYVIRSGVMALSSMSGDVVFVASSAGEKTTTVLHAECFHEALEDTPGILDVFVDDPRSCVCGLCEDLVARGEEAYQIIRAEATATAFRILPMHSVGETEVRAVYVHPRCLDAGVDGLCFPYTESWLEAQKDHAAYADTGYEY